jgi:hypothetical protein
VALGPMTQKSRLTSSSENGMYWLASALDLEFHLLLAQAGRQHDLLGDHRRLRHGHHDLLGAGAALADHAAHGLGHLVELLDLAVGDPALLEGLGSEALEHEFADCVWPSSTSLTLDELMSRPIIGGCLRPSSASRKLTRTLPCARQASNSPRIVKKLLQC